MSRFTLLFLSGAILTVCAVFIYDARAWVLTGLMLFLPFLDQPWRNAQAFHCTLDFKKLFNRNPSLLREAGVTSIGNYPDHQLKHSEITGATTGPVNTNARAS